ncbi:mannose-P-dolichol utilization defect 1 protein [Crepidotus variabilis]|uniref:Mannose-P-dolichol utilization defect 1 protein n=1 Tax=Crepidotus variabilis TaxID=179855 RepID=A0A9P6EAU6_9AGAR|nr:mannose-P-dolichol utilization defect 1 protein [Crepidotus variabilis]
MTAITKNLPWFIRDLGISIVGEECYKSLVENLNVGDVKCLKYSLSKGLGIGIVLGGSIMKVPQILLITNARSAHGLSLPAYVLETLSYAITLAYSFRHDFPFSTYGENLFLTLQNTFITLLIIYYAPSRQLTGSGKTQKLVVATTLTCAMAFALHSVPIETLALLQMTTLPLSLFSKLPQIRQNLRSQSTGQLSAFAVISQIAGCLARLFTTATEVGDALVSAGFALALFLNIILGAQLWMYWGQGADLKDEIELKQRDSHVDDKPVNDVPVWQSQASSSTIYSPTATRLSSAPPTHRVATPPAAGGRKWARKVD